MGETDIREFEERINRGECSDELRRVVSQIRKVAARAGDDVEMRAHSTPGSGWGLTYKRGASVFCRMDPKPNAGHVCVCIPAADEKTLGEAGTVHRRKNAWSWVDIRDVRGAQRLEAEIHLAYARAGVSTRR